MWDACLRCYSEWWLKWLESTRTKKKWTPICEFHLGVNSLLCFSGVGWCHTLVVQDQVTLMLLFINSTYHDCSDRVGLLVFTHNIRAEGNSEACVWGPWPDPSFSPSNENCGSLARNEVAGPEPWKTGAVYRIMLIFILCHLCACVTLKHHYDNVLHVGKWHALGKALRVCVSVVRSDDGFVWKVSRKWSF